MYPFLPEKKNPRNVEARNTTENGTQRTNKGTPPEVRSKVVSSQQEHICATQGPENLLGKGVHRTTHRGSRQSLRNSRGAGHRKFREPLQKHNDLLERCRGRNKWSKRARTREKFSSEKARRGGGRGSRGAKRG